MTIKQTAGKIILYLYQLQRTVPASMRYRQLGFIDKADGTVSMTSDKKWLATDLLKISSSPSDIFNAYRFLVEKGLIFSKAQATKGAQIYVGVHLTHAGIDIVEGIETGMEGQQTFSLTFNMNVDGSNNVDSLIKDNLGMLTD